MESVSFKLPTDMVSRLEALAREDDVSVGQLIRSAIERDFRRRDMLTMPPRAEQHLLATLRARIIEDFEQADSWSELRERLVAKGYTLREAGGGLAVHDAISGRFLCRSSEIGFGYPTLLHRFSAPFPGHSLGPLLERIRGAPIHRAQV